MCIDGTPSHFPLLVFMLRGSRLLCTSWWKTFVDGTNPEDHGRQLVSKFFRSHKVCPYTSVIRCQICVGGSV